MAKKWTIRGKTQEERIEKAYQEWKSGENNSLKELAEKYKLHIPDVSKYITNQLKLNKKQK